MHYLFENYHDECYNFCCKFFRELICSHLEIIYRIMMKAKRVSARDCLLSPYLWVIQQNSCMEIRGMWMRQTELFLNQEMFWFLVVIQDIYFMVCHLSYQSQPLRPCLRKLVFVLAALTLPSDSIEKPFKFQSYHRSGICLHCIHHCKIF